MFCIPKLNTDLGCLILKRRNCYNTQTYTYFVPPNIFISVYSDYSPVFLHNRIPRNSAKIYETANALGYVFLYRIIYYTSLFREYTIPKREFYFTLSLLAFRLFAEKSGGQGHRLSEKTGGFSFLLLFLVILLLRIHAPDILLILPAA